MRRLAPLLPLLAAGALVTGCGSGRGDGTARDHEAGRSVAVVASFYPIEFAVQQVGGDHVTVSSLTKPGVEPHDVELTPKNVAAVAGAGLVVYAKGFQPAVDTAVEQEGAEHAFDVAPVANLDLAAAPESDGHAGEAAEAADGPDAARDPHFWLDPQRYAAVATAIGQRLGKTDPANAAAYARNAESFADRLGALDRDFRSVLGSCTRKDLVTSHAAFGYLSERYGFTQVAIAGLSPEAEPSAARLATVADFVRAHGVTTIYTETLVEPEFADTVARTVGVSLATLDPIEGLTTTSAGRDYLEVMRADLRVLQAGQGCSA